MAIKVTADSDLLTPMEVARIFRVDARTVTRWARQGLISSIRTVGGHFRFERAEMERLLAESRVTRQA